MFVFELKAKHFRVLAGCVIVAAAAAVAIRFLPETPSSVTVNGTAVESGVGMDGIRGEEDVLRVLTSLGYATEPTPVEKVQVKLPKKFDAVYEAYNAVQLAEGFNLAKYAGKTLTRYTYRVTKLPDGSVPQNELLCSVLVCKKRIVGGDLYDKGGDGTVSGFLQ